jgi:uncharacterized protein (DUF433 family)
MGAPSIAARGEKRHVWRMSLIVTNPEILGGEPVFAGTRVPAKTLTDYLEGGETIDAFLDDFPSVTRGQVIEFLEAARMHLVAAAK